MYNESNVMYIRCNTFPMMEDQRPENSMPYDKRISYTVRLEDMTVGGFLNRGLLGYDIMQFGRWTCTY
jgi:hypothetical protein